MKRKLFGPVLAAICLMPLILAATGARAAGSPPETPAPAVVEPDAPANPEQTPAPESSDTPKETAGNYQDINVRPMESELSRDALETYAYLLFIQAILDEDEAAILEVAPLLGKFQAPQNVWLDGGVWLMSRKSPNSVSYLEQALKSLPDDLSINLLYAEALGDHGMVSRGVERMREFLRAHPDALDARLELALLLVRDGQFDEAQKILTQIPAKDRQPYVDYYQAKTLIGMGRGSEAIPYLRKAARNMADPEEALTALAIECEKDGNYKEARSTYEKLRKLNNLPPEEVAMKLVTLSLKLKQPEKALEYIRTGPESMGFRLRAASALMESRHYLQAEGILKRIVSQKNAPVEVYLLLADLVYEQRHNLDMAFSWLDKIPQDSPGADRACVLRVQLLADAGKTARAIEAADKGLERFPDMLDLYDLKIRLLAREKKLDQAMALAREAVGKWPDNTSLDFLLGSLLDETGKKKEALDIMENILKKQPDNYQALNYVGFTLAEENRDLERALSLLKKADELSPNQAYIVDSLAWALFRAGQGEEALKQIRRAINLGDATDATIWEHYGDIARQQGHRDEARRAYRKAIDLKPANIDDIRGRLSKI